MLGLMREFLEEATQRYGSKDVLQGSTRSLAHVIVQPLHRCCTATMISTEHCDRKPIACFAPPPHPSGGDVGSKETLTAARTHRQNPIFWVGDHLPASIPCDFETDAKWDKDPTHHVCAAQLPAFSLSPAVSRGNLSWISRPVRA
jgi:hypothetical protein